MATFSQFAIEAFGADSAPWFDERIRQRMGTCSKLDPSKETPAAVLEGIVGKGRCSDILGDGHFDFATWYCTDHHKDGSCRLSVRYPPAADNRLVAVAEVIMRGSANRQDDSLDKGFIFKSKKEAKHTAAFIFIVKLLDHADENPPARNWRNVLPTDGPVEEVAAEAAEEDSVVRAAEEETAGGTLGGDGTVLASAVVPALLSAAASGGAVADSSAASESPASEMYRPLATLLEGYGSGSDSSTGSPSLGGEATDESPAAANATDGSTNAPHHDDSNGEEKGEENGHSLMPDLSLGGANPSMDGNGPTPPGTNRSVRSGLSDMSGMSEALHELDVETTGVNSSPEHRSPPSKLRRREQPSSSATRHPSHFSSLRFSVGRRVECWLGSGPTGSEWGAGTIRQLWYRHDSWPQGHFVPYLVELDNGRRMVCLRQDVNEVIRPVLRFSVGRRVECWLGSGPTGSEWGAGTIRQLWYQYRDKGQWAPYLVELDDKRRICPAQDVDQAIRLPQLASAAAAPLPQNQNEPLINPSSREPLNELELELGMLMVKNRVGANGACDWKAVQREASPGLSVRLRTFSVLSMDNVLGGPLEHRRQYVFQPYLKALLKIKKEHGIAAVDSEFRNRLASLIEQRNRDLTSYPFSLGRIFDKLGSQPLPASQMGPIMDLIQRYENDHEAVDYRRDSSKVSTEAYLTLKAIVDRGIKINGYAEAQKARAASSGDHFTRQELHEHGIRAISSNTILPFDRIAPDEVASVIESAPNRQIRSPPPGTEGLRSGKEWTLHASDQDKTLAGLCDLLMVAGGDADSTAHHKKNFLERIVYTDDGKALFPIFRWKSNNPIQDPGGLNKCFYLPGTYRNMAPATDQLNRDNPATTMYNKDLEVLNWHQNKKGVSTIHRPVGGTIEVNDLACEYAFSGPQGVQRMLDNDFVLHRVDMIDVTAHLFNQLVDKNYYGASYLRNRPGTGIFEYTHHVNASMLSPIQIMLNTPTKSSTNILGPYGGRVCSAGWMACFGTTSGICPVREQVDCINLKVVIRATDPPYNSAAFEPANPPPFWAVVIESLTNMAFSWPSEKSAMVINGYRYHH